MHLQATQLETDTRPESAPANSLEYYSSGPDGRVIPLIEEEYCCVPTICDVLQHRFSLNGEVYDLGDDIAWLSNPSDDIEWHILLHKFYYAPGLARAFERTGNDRYKRCFEELISSWIEKTPVDFIASDVTARRIQNWIYAWQLFHESDTGGFSKPFSDAFLGSLREQVNSVCANLAPARNHRTLELYAIFVASVAFSRLDHGERWRRLSVSELLRNIESDLLNDGVHCELSTDYHHIVLRSYLLLFRICEMHQIELPRSAADRVCRALDFAMHVHRPDGDIPALSDSDSRSFLNLLRWGSRLFNRQDYAFVASRGAEGTRPSEQHRIFSEGGYAILRSPWTNGDKYADARYLVMDVGDVGAGNHGHLDALSIEVAAFGKALVVDPGRYTYDEQGDYNWRAHFRETAAHNTVTINRCDQAIYQQQGVRRKIQMPRPDCRLVSHELFDDLAYLHGKVVGPNYSASHHRHIWFVDNRYWVVLDRLCADAEHHYALRYQLTPAAKGGVTLSTGDSCTAVQSRGLKMLILQDEPSVAEERGFVSELYGMKAAAPRICAQAAAGTYSFLTLLYPTTTSSSYLSAETNQTRRVVNLRDETRRHSWSWDQRSQVMIHRTAKSVQAWRLAEGGTRG